MTAPDLPQLVAGLTADLTAPSIPAVAHWLLANGSLQVPFRPVDLEDSWYQSPASRSHWRVQPDDLALLRLHGELAKIAACRFPLFEAEDAAALWPLEQTAQETSDLAVPSRSLKVGLIGTVGSGKSTLGNALLRRHLLPMGFLGCTKEAIFVRHRPGGGLHPEERAAAQGTEPLEGLPWGGNRLTLEGLEGLLQRSRVARRGSVLGAVAVEAHVPALGSKLALVDLPGIGGPEHDDATLWDAVRNLDVCIHVVGPGKANTTTTEAFARAFEANPGARHLVVLAQAEQTESPSRHADMIRGVLSSFRRDHFVPVYACIRSPTNGRF